LNDSQIQLQPPRPALTNPNHLLRHKPMTRHITMFSKLSFSLTILTLALTLLSTTVTTVSAAPQGIFPVSEAAFYKGLSPDPESAPGVQHRCEFPVGI
jgi:hypothetical protein